MIRRSAMNCSRVLEAGPEKWNIDRECWDINLYDYKSALNSKENPVQK